MNTGHLTHLTDAQFSNLLAEEAADIAAATHLQACDSCRRELTAMHSAVGNLRNFSLRWSEERAARIVPPSRWTLGWHRLPSWSAAVALLLCGLALGIHFQRTARAAAPEIGQSQTIASAPSEDELMEDNQLLRSIDRELSRQVRPQVPAAELSVSSRSLPHRVLSEVSN